MPEQNPIDQLFKERLQGHNMQPSAAVWQKVAAAQKTSSTQTGPLYLLRAAAIALLIGLSAVMQFSVNQGSLSAYQPLTLQEKGVSRNAQMPLENTSAPEPQKETPAQAIDEQATKQVKPSKATLPVLKQPTKANQIFVANSTPETNEQELKYDSELPLEGEGATVALAVADENATPVYSITIRDLPETAGYYGPDTSASPKPKFSQKLMAYASSQVNRLLAGEKPQLPKTNKKPELAIALPKFLTK